MGSIVDPDNNGCIDFEDLDGDGIPDIIDSFVGFGTSSWQQVSSAYVNLDSDSDGIFDIEEIRIDLVVSNTDASTQIVGSTPDSAEIVVNVICSDTTCTPQEIDDFLDNFDTIFVPGETGVLLMNGNQLTLSVCGSERIQEQVLTLQETVSSIQIERVTYGIDCSDINYYYGFYDFYESSLSTMVIPSFITMLMSLFLLL